MYCCRASDPIPTNLLYFVYFSIGSRTGVLRKLFTSNNIKCLFFSGVQTLRCTDP